MAQNSSSAAIYCRISLDRDLEQLGVQRQEQDCKELAERLKWTVGEVYVDNSISAPKDVDRPAYDRMVTDLTSGNRDALVVYDLDRLIRKPAELEAFIALSESKVFALANVAGDVDLTTANGRMLARFKGAIAKQEAERILFGWGLSCTRTTCTRLHRSGLARGRSTPCGTALPALSVYENENEPV